MYSPKINESVVRILYRVAQHRRMPMTELVNELLLERLEQSDLPEEARQLFENLSQVAVCREDSPTYSATDSSTKDEQSSP